MPKLSPTLKRWLRQQQMFIAVSVVFYAMFVALHVPVLLLAVLISAFLCGNGMQSAMQALHFVYAGRRSPYNWLLFTALLMVVAPVTVTIAIWVTGWLMFPPSVMHWKIILPFWEFSLIACVVFALGAYGYTLSKQRLESRNVELEQALNTGKERIELQDQELQRAREIQESLLPREIPKIDNFEIAGIWRPARTVGGDYYDVLKFGEDKLAICIGDVVGKGISAALLMANIQAAVRAFASGDASPAWLCSRINNVLCGNIANDKFVTFFYGLLDGKTRTLTYCNAGHLPPILLRRDGESGRLDDGGLVLGVTPKAHYAEGVVELRVGDKLLLFTDGITEAAAVDEEEYGDGRIESLAQRCRQENAGSLIERVLEDAGHFCDSQFADDATMLVVAAVPGEITQTSAASAAASIPV